jgi:hypothetical protein
MDPLRKKNKRGWIYVKKSPINIKVIFNKNKLIKHD